MYVLFELLKKRPLNLGLCIFLALTGTVSGAIINCPTNRVISASTNCMGSLPDLTGELESDSGGTPTQDPAPATLLPLGTNTVTFTITDTNGVTDHCSALVTVVDDAPPVFVICATNQSLAAGANCLLSMPDLTSELTVTDACSAVTVTQDPLAGTALTLGDHLVTFTATDAVSNSSTCTLTLSVIDNLPPVISSGPTNMTLSAGTNCAAVTPDLTGQIVATDCSPFAVTQNPLPGTLLPLGTNGVVLTATDTNGFSAAWAVILTVVDDTPPVFVVCATNQSLAAGPGCSLTMPDLTSELTVTDACSAVTVTQDPAAGTTLTLGDHLVTFTATDAVSNSSTCTLTLSVIDNLPPVISSGPTNMTLSAGTNCAAVAPNLTGQIVATDCSPFAVTQNPLPGSLLPLGTNGVVLTATDTNGFSAAWSVILTVVDDTPPVFVVCATNQSLAAGPGCSATMPDLTGELTVTDACSAVTVTQDPVTGTTLTLGDHLVTFTARDAASNSSTCTLTLSVIDNSAPVISSGPTNRTLVATTNCAALAPDLTGEIVATDCSSFTVTQNPVPESLLPLGTNTVVLTATDTNGFNASFSVHITVVLPATANTNITISEFMAKNTFTLADEDGTFSDWIEIHNAGTCPVNLNNWSLTDKASQLTEWRFPNTNIAAGQFLVVWASGKDRRTPGAPLHTNFKCDDAGEYLALVQPDGVTIATQFSPQFLPQVADISYGLASDTQTYTYLAQPTPGGPNSVSTNFNTGSCATNIIISEFMAKNTSTLADEDGDFSDWIEIHNGSACPLNLNNWCLTDDATQLAKWRFPSTNLPSGQFLVVFASNKNRRVPGAPLHTNFKMADQGEYLALVRPDGLSVASQFSPMYPSQFADISYGLPSNRPTNDYLAFPTPGAANAPATNFFISALRFHPPRGYYTNSVSLFIGTPTVGATIYCTTDGSVPSPTNGFVFTNNLFLTNTTVIRAGAFLAGYESTFDVHTYVFPQQVTHQTGAGFPPTWSTNHLGGIVPAIYACASNVVSVARWSNQVPAALISLPTVSIAMKTDDMFGFGGLYANTLIGLDDGTFEKPCSFEYFSAAFPSEFQVNCGIQIQGSTSRDPLETPKHNFRFLFKEIYGPTKLNFDLYPGSGVTEFNTVALHGSFNDHWFFLGPRAQMLRDQWASDTQREMGEFGRHGNYVNLFINGLYWGMYDLGERPDADYAATYLGGQASDYDALSNDETRDGTNTTWNALIGFAARPGGITTESDWSNMVYNLDVPGFIDYLLMNFYADNEDWPGQNYWTTGSPSHGVPFHFFSYDAEQLFLNITNNLTGITGGSPGILYTALRAWPDFNRMFADHAQKLLFNGGMLTPERCAARYMKRAQEINLGIIGESARWGFFQFPWSSGPVMTQDDWLAEKTNLLANWFPQRTDILIQQLRDAGLYPALAAPVLTPFNGIIVGSLPVTMSAPIGDIYYTTNGTDPRLSDGTISPDALLYSSTLNLTNTVQVQARVFETNAWSALVSATYQRSEETTVQIRSVTLMPDNSVHLEFFAWPGVSYTLQASSDLGVSAWENLATLTPSFDGSFDFTDVAAPNHPMRFYRLAWP